MKLQILAPAPLGTIEPEIYGHFSEHIGGVIYDGIWVGEDSPIPNINGFRKELVEKLRAIKPAVLRWPGGCFAETYDWRDGIGPREKRPRRINWWRNSDGRYEPNAFGTDEFVDFCRLIGAEPYFAANITSLTPLAIRDWMDYCNSPAGTTTLADLRAEYGHTEPLNVRYWGVGNETWGGGGNMLPDVYANEFRRYATLMNNADPNAQLIVSGANHHDWTWTRDLLNNLESSCRFMNGMSLHFYCGTAGTATSFTEEEYYRVLRQALDIERTIDRNWGFSVGFGLEKHTRLVIDEWGCWHPGGSGPSANLKNNSLPAAINNPNRVENLFEQQSTMRDAVVAAATLNVFNNNPEKIMMANVAQLINNLHSLFLSGGDNLICTPTYYVFGMMKGHQGGEALRTSFNTPEITFMNKATGVENSLPGVSVSASRKDGMLTVTIANLSIDTSEAVELEPLGMKLGASGSVEMLTADDVHSFNTFEEPERVKTSIIEWHNGEKLNIPPYSVITLTAPIEE